MSGSVQTKVSAQFPSLAFFQTLAGRMNAQTEKYKKFGPVDLRLGIRIESNFCSHGDEFYGLVFSDYWCDEAVAYDDPAKFGAECTIAGPCNAWKDMFENIRAHGQADDKHTLNRLIHLDRPLRIEATDQYEADKVYRFMHSLQLFVEESAGLDIQYLA